MVGEKMLGDLENYLIFQDRSCLREACSWKSEVEKEASEVEKEAIGDTCFRRMRSRYINS